MNKRIRKKKRKKYEKCFREWIMERAEFSWQKEMVDYYFSYGMPAKIKINVDFARDNWEFTDIIINAPLVELVDTSDLSPDTN